MNAQSRLFTSFMVLCLFYQAFLVQGQTFKKVWFLKTTGDKANEIKAHLIVTEDSIQVRDSQFSRTLKEVPYSEIKDVTYSFSKHRRWGKKHWLTFEIEEDRLALRLDKSNFKAIRSAVDRSILSAANRRLQDAVALDGYREGANRIDTPSLENKGESTQNIERERRILPRASYAQHQEYLYREFPGDLRQWITTYLEELPNFVCDYTEHHYERGIVSEWVSMDMNQGEVRYIDGRSDYRVMSGSGKPTGETIWEVSNIPHSFSAIRNFLVPSANYRFTPQGEGAFSFQSDSGGGLVPGWTRAGTPLEGGRSYPSWGTVRVQKPEHRVLSVREYFEVSKRGWLARTFTSGFPPGEYAWFAEYGFVNIGEQPYWLVKQVEFMRSSSTDRVVQTYDNCRRFESDVISIRYGAEVATVQPDTGQAPGGTGGESPTAPPAPETGWEDGADPDSARVADRSPTIPPQPPRAAPQPPLSAVLTSPKRNAPFEGTPTDYVGGGGGGSENRPLKRYGYHSTHQPPPDSFIPSRYGYYGSEPSLDSPATLTGDLLSRYGYHPVEYTPLEPKEEEEAAARSASWWFVLMVGIVAFSGGFFGNFLRGKAE